MIQYHAVAENRRSVFGSKEEYLKERSLGRFSTMSDESWALYKQGQIQIALGVDAAKAFLIAAGFKASYVDKLYAISTLPSKSIEGLLVPCTKVRYTSGAKQSTGTGSSSARTLTLEQRVQYELDHFISVLRDKNRDKIKIAASIALDKGEKTSTDIEFQAEFNMWKEEFLLRNPNSTIASTIASNLKYPKRVNICWLR